MSRILSRLFNKRILALSTMLSKRPINMAVNPSLPVIQDLTLRDATNRNPSLSYAHTSKLKEMQIPTIDRDINIPGYLQNIFTSDPKKGKILFLGDYHPDNGIKEFIINNMHNFRALNVKRLFIEMVESGKQKYIDQYFLNKINEIELEKHLREEKSWVHTPEMLSLIVGIIKAAKDNGIQVIAINNGQEEVLGKRNIYWANIIKQNQPLDSVVTRFAPREQYI